ncbi:MAG: hypothetical protein WDO18_05435 [Acidobacteriota bacterium]
MAGLFSFLDALLDCPLDVALSGIGLASPILEALLGTAREGEPLSMILDLVRSYEAGEWEKVTAPAEELGIDGDLIRNSYYEAVAWAGAVDGGDCPGLTPRAGGEVEEADPRR